MIIRAGFENSLLLLRLVAGQNEAFSSNLVNCPERKTEAIATALLVECGRHAIGALDMELARGGPEARNAPSDRAERVGWRRS